MAISRSNGTRHDLAVAACVCSKMHGMYLLHYVFVVWLQYALLDAALFAAAEAVLVFGMTLFPSWTVSATMHRFHRSRVSWA
jgi:hypothetical protein